ncbi:MAG: YdgA family protein, partial [Gammaproteobacteria bacterium]|nr:YdgA family protein [Gammaproteobacteria bacterium]
MQNLPRAGDMKIDMVFELLGADAELLGRVQQSAERAKSAQDPMALYEAAEKDLLGLFASGFEMNLERFDFTLPEGTITSRANFSFAARDPADFAWTSLLMTTEASIDIAISDAVMQLLLEEQPGAAMIIGGGYLVKRGDTYELKAEMRKGLLTVNGAPIPIPFGGMR